MLLSELKIGKSAKILSVGGAGELRQHLLDMGLIPGGLVKLMKYAPMGDPWNSAFTTTNLRCAVPMPH